MFQHFNKDYCALTPPIFPQGPPKLAAPVCQESPSSQEAQLPRGEWWSDGDSQEPGLVKKNRLLIRMCWTYLHLPRSASGTLQEQQSCRVTDG